MTEETAAGYRLITQIGFGPLGVVWEAEGPEGDVAVTVVAKAMAEVPETRRALRRAAEEAAQLAHHGLARMLGSRELYGELLLLAERLEGETLAARLTRKPPLTEGEVGRIAGALAEALAWLHQRGMVHGGVNPENVFLTKNGQVKLLHTGEARVWVETLLRRGDAAEVASLAPELGAGNNTITAAADIWALGALMQRLAPSAAALAGLVAGCQQRDPAQRPAAAVLCRELGEPRAAAESAPGAAAEPEQAASPRRYVAAETDADRRRVQRRVLGVLAVAGGLLLVALVAAGWYLATHPELFAGSTVPPAARRGAAAGDPAAAGVVVTARLKTARFSAPAAFVDGMVYVFGGNSAGTILATAESYDPATKRSTQLATGFLPRSCHVARAADGLVYLVGGLEENGVSGKLEIFTPGGSGEVSMGAPMPTPRFNAAAAVLDGKLYVAGGSTRSAADLTDVVEIYDIGNDRWTAGAPLPSPRQTELVAWGGKIYALGGFPGEGSSDECYAYDPQQDEWRTLAALAYPVSAHRAVALGSELYTFGSYDALDQVLRFKARKWERVAVPFLPRRHAGLAADRDRVWIIGGTTDGTKALDAIQEFAARQLAGAAVQ